MNAPRPPGGMAAHPGLSWAVFCGVSGLVLVACVVMGLTAGGRSTAALALLGGLILVGLAAALMDAIVSPYPKHDGRQQVPYGSRGVGGS